MEQSKLYKSVRDYTLLQFYALAIFNYATGDLLSRLSSISWLPNNGNDSEYHVCDWDYIVCDGGTDTIGLPVGGVMKGLKFTCKSSIYIQKSKKYYSLKICCFMQIRREVLQHAKVPLKNLHLS